MQKKLHRQGAKTILDEGILEYPVEKVIL